MFSGRTAMDSDTASTPLFNCGLDLAGLAASSDLLHLSWGAISDLRANPSPQAGSSPVSVEYRESQVGNFRIIAFAASSPVPEQYLQGEGSGLVLSAEVPDFKFLCSKRNPDFSINKAAKHLFDSVRSELSSLKAQVVENSKSTPYLITGNSLRGSVASLFTLWLLDALDPIKTKRPLCITFGSPHLGDARFQEAVSRFQSWISCFLHVVHGNDPFPCCYASEDYRPFGTFLFLSGSGKACFEAPDSISELLERMKLARSGNQGVGDFDYRSSVEQLQDNAICEGVTKSSWRGEFDSYKVGILSQLISIGLLKNEQDYRGRNNWVDKKIVKPEKRAITDKREMFDPARKLSELKRNMAQLEWYKKVNELDGYTYYDTYKTKRLMRDHTVVALKKALTDYWERVVEEVEKKPQREESYMRRRWLYAGTNFRRMVEPLDIAEYYKVRGRRDYLTRGRLNSYAKLERWLKEAQRPAISLRTRMQNIKSSLTEDSSFWAHVEEARISCEAYKNGETENFKKFSEFANYVFGMIEKYSLSAEIFIPDSSYMKWWAEYDNILRSRPDAGQDYNSSQLVLFMRNRRYDEYKEGRYDPSEDD